MKFKFFQNFQKEGLEGIDGQIKVLSIPGVTKENVGMFSKKDLEYLQGRWHPEEKPPVYIDRNKIEWKTVEAGDTRSGFGSMTYAEKEQVDAIEPCPCCCCSKGIRDKGTLTLSIIAIKPPAELYPNREKRIAEIERQLREGMEQALRELREKHDGRD